jgi:hypothetical protein
MTQYMQFPTKDDGTILVEVDVEAIEGFDPVWLRNAVLEPLEEAHIEVEREENEQT